LENITLLTKQSSINFLFFVLLIHCAQLPLQEQEDFDPEAHLACLPEAKYFCACLG
jgi:hypothetical protein